MSELRKETYLKWDAPQNLIITKAKTDYIGKEEKLRACLDIMKIE